MRHESHPDTMRQKMKLRFFFLLLFFIGFSSEGQAQTVTTISIHPTETRQTIQGFGASGAWWSQVIGGWSDENRQQIIDLLFDPSTGIGLTMYRYNIGGGEQGLIDPWRNTETFETGPGEYDWTRDANALWVLHAARDAGVTDVIVFANSAPGRMTVSGRSSGNPGGASNLLPDMHDDFAQYLVDVTRHLIEDENLPVRWISPINEPQWDWQPSKGQEGTHYTTDEIVSVLLALQDAINQSELDVEISTVEAGEWNTAPIYTRRIFEEPVLAEALDHFAVHSYWSTAEDKEQFADFAGRHHPGLPLWMSEWTEMQQGRDYGMDSALVLANTVHDDLTIGGVTSWQYWIAVSKYNFRDGLIYTREYGERIEETKRLWALGNYSRFVRPGAVRVDVSAENEALRVSGYLNPEPNSLVLVVINNSVEPQSITLSNGDFQASGLSVYETSETHDLAQIYSGEAQDAYTLAPTSITTFVFEPAEGP